MYPAPLDELDPLHQVEVDAVGVMHDAVGIRTGHHLGSQLLELLHCVDGDVPRPRHDTGTAIEVGFPCPQHLVDEVHRAVAGRFGTHERATPFDAFAGHRSGLVSVGDAFVLPEQETDLSAADADVAGGDVGVLTDVAVELGHEGLTEAHDLAVGSLFRVEVGSALAAADRHAGEGVLERLLEAQELDGAEADRWVEAQPALVGPQRTVGFDPEAAVDVHLSLVVFPRNPKDDLSFGFADSLDDLASGELRVLGHHRAQRVQDLSDRLMEFGFGRVATDDLDLDVFEFGTQHPQSMSGDPTDRRHDG